MKKSLFNKRIPTFLGLIIITVGIAFTTWYANENKLTVQQQAFLLTEPQNVMISNITDTSFTVSYTTQGPITGSLNYDSQNKLGKLGLDDRDQNNGNPSPYLTHVITVSRLKPATIYYFAISSNSENFLHNGSPYQVTTGVAIKDIPSNQFPLVGKIADSNGKPAENVLIYVTGDNTQTLSTITKKSGTFSLPLNSMRLSDLTSYAPLSPSSKLTITAVSNTDKATGLLLTSQAQPAPQMTLGQNYDFTNSSNPIVYLTPTGTQTALLPTHKPDDKTGTPKIVNPEKDNQQYTDQQPEFTGIAVPNNEVTIEVHSDNPQTATITTASDGTWAYRPQIPLAPGKHTITMITKDALGIVHRITKNFTVYAAGSQLGTEPSIHPTPTDTLTPTPNISPTIQPTEQPSQTPTPVIITTTPVPTSTVSTGSATLSPSVPPNKLPGAGSNIIVVAGIIGAVIMGFGFVLFFIP